LYGTLVPHPTDPITGPIFSCQTNPIRAAVTACANPRSQGAARTIRSVSSLRCRIYPPSKAQAGKFLLSLQKQPTKPDVSTSSK
jgi:hypothetical protein